MRPRYREEWLAYADAYTLANDFISQLMVLVSRGLATAAGLLENCIKRAVNSLDAALRSFPH